MGREVEMFTRMRLYLPERAVELVEAAADIASARQESLYLVGGVVRDLLLGRSCQDIDLVVEGDAIGLAREVAGEQQKVTTHDEFGTATLKGNGFSLDFATARRETYLRPGALPTVRPSNISDDLFRRDFSINAMAVFLTGAFRGGLLDLWGGRSDLDNGLVRILHDRSFIDDATRILRAVRYEQRLSFNLEPGTEFLLKRDVPMLDTVSGDRLRHELERILCEEYPERALHRAGELGVWKQIYPALQGDGMTAEALRHARGMACPRSLPLHYALFLYRLSEGEAEQVMSRLSVSGEVARTVRDAISLGGHLDALAVADLRPSQVFAMLTDYAPEAVLANLAAAGNPTVRERLSLFLERLRHVRPSLSGDDLIALGARPGPQVGELLARLRRAKLDSEVVTRDDEVALTLRLLSGQSD